MARWTIRPRELSGATTVERRVWLLVVPLELVGCGLVLGGVTQDNTLTSAVGASLLLVALVLTFTITLRLQRRASARRLAELAAARAAMFERHEAERVELKRLRRVVQDERNDAS